MDVDVDQYRMIPKEEEEDTQSRPLAGGGRPATYVVPNLVSLLLLPMSEAGGGGAQSPRMEFGTKVDRDLADTLNLNDFRQPEPDRAFELIDSDGNGRITWVVE